MSGSQCSGALWRLRFAVQHQRWKTTVDDDCVLKPGAKSLESDHYRRSAGAFAATLRQKSRGCALREERANAHGAGRADSTHVGSLWVAADSHAVGNWSCG